MKCLILQIAYHTKLNPTKDTQMAQINPKNKSWKDIYPSEQTKKDILTGYEISRSTCPLFRMMSTKWGYRLTYLCAFIWYTFLTYNYLFNFQTPYILLKIGLLIFLVLVGMFTANLIFCTLHVVAHMCMLKPEELGPIDSKQPVVYHAYYHHFSSKIDDWYPMLGTKSTEAVRVTNAAHIHAFTLFTRPITLAIVLALSLLFPPISALFLGFDIGGMLIGPAHISQHDNDKWDFKPSKYFFLFLQKIGIFTHHDFHHQHHMHDNEEYIFSSFVSSGILNPIFPFLEKQFDAMFCQLCDNYNHSVIETFKNSKHPMLYLSWLFPRRR
jgi:hypothetical protein